MPKQIRTFLKGRMDKVTDVRLLAEGTYIDALNIRLGSTENSELGAIENSKGNLPLTSLQYIDGTPLSDNARCIGSIDDSANETIYWFVHDPTFSVGATGKLDLIVSFNTFSSTLTYHIVSIDDGGGENTTLNFNPQYLITGIDRVLQTTLGVQSNLVFFTEYYNQPRFFNSTRNYPVPIANIDQFSAESILVIKKPPIESPSISTFLTGGQENFIDTRFICFAYRYRYEDNDYSATSQWSEPAFVPGNFNFSVDSYLNEGMVNSHNTVQILFNSGGPLVKSIDLLFKEATTGLINIIEKRNKEQLGYSDNTVYPYIFNNSKIFTVLPAYELLRLYDNVPLLAKSLTIMGNRLMYGNYVEGYNMVDLNNQPVKLIYTTELQTEEIGLRNLVDLMTSGNYNINGPQVISDSVLQIDFIGLTIGTTGVFTTPLPAGGSISIEVTLNHNSFSGDMPRPAETSKNIQVTFSFFLLNTYTSVYQLATSAEFQDAIGTAINIQTVPNSCNGTTFTDLVNCQIPNNLDALTKFASGINADGQPIQIQTSPASRIIGLQFPAMRFVDNVVTPTKNVYEYYSITFAEVMYQSIANPQSLHSNRGYEVGIVYMDEFNRSTTALVSSDNTVFVPCGNSGLKNSIQITIPATQRPPVWASRYKFVIKTDRENYQTIYCNIFFEDPQSNAAFFLLEGENAQKVEKGDRLIVKADSSGVVQNCAYATVLDKTVEASGFLTIPSTVNPAVNIPVPAGVYIKINPNSFEAVQNEFSTITYGTIQVTQGTERLCPTVSYLVSIKSAIPGMYQDYSIPAGSRIRLFFKFERIGTGNNCEARNYILDRTLISSTNYDSFKEWWDGDNISLILNSGSGNYIDNEYNVIEGAWLTPLTCNFTNHYQFQKDALTGAMFLVVNGIPTCTGVTQKTRRQSKLWVNIEVFRADTTLIFETEPSEALPDIFFENNLSFAIIGNNHQGNVQNQNFATNTPAIIDSGFYNCFAFGNGAESYRIRDSAAGKTFNFGIRVTSVSAQDYKRAIRFADMTYSGVFNDESNINKLNEFNLGLANFKALEDSFGPINKMDSRETDILVLQEDKISYVLAGKNLLSDAAAGGAITSIPEVLGTQIARTEKYGISNNPESYAHWGYDRYFTDIKRGVVIQLKGNSYSNDQLTIVSDFGMRTYFRDLFIEAFNTQKLGGYDPYMNEYVLVVNDIELPGDQPCLACGITQTFDLEVYEPKTFCTNVGQLYGSVVVSWQVVTNNIPFELNITYNGITTGTGLVTESGFIVITKNLPSVQTVSVEVMSLGDMVIQVNVSCPFVVPMTVVQVAVTNNSDSGKFIHDEYSYTDGIYVGPVMSSLVTFASGSDNPLVSFYSAISGNIGAGNIPVPGSTVRLAANKIGFDTFDFNTSNNHFRRFVSDTLYGNTPTEMAALLAASTLVTPNLGSGNYHYGEFTMPSPQDYLYLIWDYRSSQQVDLCYSDVSAADACCNCCDSDCSVWVVGNNEGSGGDVTYHNCDTGAVTVQHVLAYHNYIICGKANFTPGFTSGFGTVQLLNVCGCSPCGDSCLTYKVVVSETANIEYISCTVPEPVIVSCTPGTYYFCTSLFPPNALSGAAIVTFEHCGCNE